jgi:hypothetical protein
MRENWEPCLLRLTFLGNSHANLSGPGYLTSLRLTYLLLGHAVTVFNRSLCANRCLAHAQLDAHISNSAAKIPLCRLLMS